MQYFEQVRWQGNPLCSKCNKVDSKESWDLLVWDVSSFFSLERNKIDALARAYLM